jgi:hypothetical protein
MWELLRDWRQAGWEVTAVLFTRPAATQASEHMNLTSDLFVLPGFLKTTHYPSFLLCICQPCFSPSAWARCCA